MRREVDWDKIIETHPFYRELVAERQGVEVLGEKEELEDRQEELFDAKE